MSPPHPQTWLRPLAGGLWCDPGGFFIDPTRAADRAVITHAHSDHARAGNRAVLASAPTLALMRARRVAGKTGQALAWGEPIRIGDVTIRLEPAGHVLGSAQVVIDYRGARAVVSGDYKRRPDPTCNGFVPVPCDVFVTEATFGLPVFRHPPAAAEIARLLASVALYPGRCHLIGCYSLGKTQRLIALLRQAGWDRPLFLHPALAAMCTVYEQQGIALGDLRPIPAHGLAGDIVLAPPSATAGPLADPVICHASGWMRLRQRAQQSGAELPLIISDHADWDELLATMDDVAAPEIWITHGTEDALIRAATIKGIRARPLRLVGYGDEES